MKDFFRFLKHPFTPDKQYHFAETLLKSFLILTALLLTSALIKYTYSQLNAQNAFPFLDNLYYNRIHKILINRGPILSLIIAGIIGPLAEELVFRLGISFNKKHLSISIALLTLYIPYIFALNIFLTIGSIVLVSTLLLFYTKRISQAALNQFKEKHGAIVVHLSAILFTTIHLNNVTPLTSKFILEYIILLIPILSNAYILSYIRVRLGFIYAVLLHACFNSITFGLFIWGTQ